MPGSDLNQANQDGMFVLNPENICSFEKRRPQITLTVTQSPRQFSSSKEVQMFDDLIDDKNNHFQSLQKAIVPWEQQQDDQATSKNQHTKSLNRDFSQQNMKTSSINQLYLRKSTLSRNSSVRSFAERSQREILSPFYKPFEIFFSYRKKSPYLTQRSQNQNNTASPNQEGASCVQGTINLDQNKKSMTSSFQPQSTFNCISNRSQTPSFQTMLSDGTGLSKNQNSQQNSNIVDNSKSIHSYFNNHIKKKIRIQSHLNIVNETNLTNQQQSKANRQLSRNSKQDFISNDNNKITKQKSNKAKFHIKSDDDLNYSSDNDIDPNNHKISQLEENEDIKNEQINIYTLNVIENKPEHKRQKSQYRTINDDQEKQCCHVEGQRHQMTRYALEKSLKLAEVLMKEVQRLDLVVQNQKILLNQTKDTYEDVISTEAVIEKRQMSKIKRELFKEIENLNQVQQSDIMNPCKDTLKSLYKPTLRHSCGNESKKQKHSKENNCLKDSSNLIADEMSLELKPEMVKPYLKLITEASVNINNNQGALRKDVWEYINRKYNKSIDYREFLLAIRRFLLEGKLINSDGIYTMHPEVIEEVREKTPTPVFKSKSVDGKQIENNMVLNFWKPIQDDQAAGTKASLKKNAKQIDSKISDSGKKQKVKPVKESTRQSKIQTYFMRRQMDKHQNPYDYYVEFDPTVLQNKKLGFATPAFEQKVYSEHIDDKLTPKKTRRDQASKRLGLYQKQRDHIKKNQLRRKILDNNIHQVTKRISKAKKINNNPKDINHKKTSQKPEKKINKSAQPTNDAANIKDIESKKQLEQEAAQVNLEITENVIEKKKELKEKKEKAQSKKKDQLTSSVIKALKQAIQTKNLQFRKNKNIRVKTQEQESELKKKVEDGKVLKRSKGIKKTQRKPKAISQLNIDKKDPNIIEKRLRGKTLDLTQLGIIKQKKVKDLPETIPQDKIKKVVPKKEKALIKRKETPQKGKKDTLKTQAPKLKPIQKRIKKVTPKAIKKTKRSKLLKQKITKILKQFNGKVGQVLDLDRKAKLDAVKNLKYLYSKDKFKDALYINEKLIYL